MFNFYGRKGTFSQVYWCECPFVRISFLAYLFEKIIMLNSCVYTEHGMKKYQKKLDLKSISSRRKFEMINWALSEKSQTENWYENQEKIFMTKELSSVRTSTNA